MCLAGTPNVVRVCEAIRKELMQPPESRGTSGEVLEVKGAGGRGGSSGCTWSRHLIVVLATAEEPPGACSTAFWVRAFWSGVGRLESQLEALFFVMHFHGSGATLSSAVVINF